MSDTYTHTTSLENLTRMLDGSRHIMALRHLARTSPDTEVSVEPLPMPIRRRMKAGDAYERMRGVKDTDRVFLSRGGWLPNYGDAVVVKRLSPRSVVRGERLNSIPEEYTTGRALSLRSNADVYVPDEVLEEFRAKYPSIRFRGRSTLPLRAYGLSDRIAALKDKLMERAGFEKQPQRTTWPGPMPASAACSVATPAWWARKRWASTCRAAVTSTSSYHTDESRHTAVLWKGCRENTLAWL